MAAIYGAGGAVVGAGLTVLGVHLSSRNNLRTVDRQLKHQAMLEEQRRADAAREVWRERRLEAHDEALGAIETWWQELDGIATEFMMAQNGETHYTAMVPSWENRIAARGAVDRVRLLATEEVAEKCLAAFEVGADLSRVLRRLRRADSENLEDYRSAVRRVQEQRLRTDQAYREAARKEIDTFGAVVRATGARHTAS